MSATDNRVRGLITLEASDWFVANRAGLGANERVSFAVWLKASPVHVEEYLAVSVIAGDLREACEGPQESLEALLARARAEEGTPVQHLWPGALAGPVSRRWQPAALMAAAFAAVSLGLLALWSLRPVASVAPPGDTMALHFEARHGEQQIHRLADNSIVHLNTDSAITIRYRKKERIVLLTSGEADFEVAHEAGRPFKVFAGSAEVVAVGTKFDVRLAHDTTVVTVVEGRVAVGASPMSVGRGNNSKPDQPLQFVQIGADQQISVTQGEWPASPVFVDAQRVTAWLRRNIMFEHEPLERVASEFNRYAPKPIEITTPALRKLEISGVFATDDTDAFIAFLRSLKGVRVEVTAAQVRVSQD